MSSIFWLGAAIFCMYRFYDTRGGWWLIGFIISVIMFIVSLVIAATKATIKVAKDVGEAIGDLIVEVVNGIVDFFTIKEEVKQKVPNAFKIMIKEKRKNAVNVRIFNRQNTPIGQMEISSAEGVDDKIQVGQVYVL